MNPLLPALRAGLRALPSPVPERQRRLTGSHALVDGIPFFLPVDSSESPALMAAFPCDAAAAARLLPGSELQLVTLPGGKALLVVAVIDYRRTDIGRYVEFSLALAVTHGTRRAPALLAGMLRGRYGTGQYVLDLPVSTEISVKGGKGIWGMPKHQANLHFTVGDDIVSSQYDHEGELACRIEVDRPPATGLPLKVAAVNYCSYRGMLMKSYVYFTGEADVAMGRRASARLDLGSALRTAPLRALDPDPDPLFTAFLPSFQGVLDDHAETWFLTSPVPVQRQPEGLESVVDLTRSEEWLAPPVRTR
jgi:hypothetical protein